MKANEPNQGWLATSQSIHHDDNHISHKYISANTTANGECEAAYSGKATIVQVGINLFVYVYETFSYYKTIKKIVVSNRTLHLTSPLYMIQNTGRNILLTYFIKIYITIELRPSVFIVCINGAAKLWYSKPTLWQQIYNIQIMRILFCERNRGNGSQRQYVPPLITGHITLLSLPVNSTTLFSKHRCGLGMDK